MTDEEIEVVAQELAKLGGSSWYPGRSDGPVLRAVHARYRDRARVAIAALERHRATKEAASPPPATNPDHAASNDTAPVNDQFQVGTIVIYRPRGERRAAPYRIEKLEDGRAYLVPYSGSDFGWVSLESLQPLNARGASNEM